MKTISNITAILIILLLFTQLSLAQVTSKNVSKMMTVLVDNAMIRAVEVTLEPNEKTAMHTHAAYFFYALTEGSLAVYYKDGTKEYFELKPGLNSFSEPEKPHVSENHGNTTVKFLIVELKEHPYKPIDLNKLH